MSHPNRAAAPVKLVEVDLQLGRHNKRVPADHLREFQEDLEALLLRAGCAGTYRAYSNHRPAKGSTHKRGITLGSPHAMGVEIFIQYGDCASRESWTICKQSHEVSEKLFARLKEAYDAMRREAKSPAKKPAGSNDDAPPAEPPHADPEPEVGTAPQDTPTETAETEKVAVRPINILNNPEDKAVFLLELAEKADGEGRVERVVARDLLFTLCGLNSNKGTGPMLKALERRELLVPTEQPELLLITDRAFALIGKERPVPKQAEVQPEPAAEQAFALPYLRRIAELEQLAAGYDESAVATALQELERLRGVEADLERQIEAARLEITSQEQRLDEIRAEQAPALEARARLAQVRELLEQ